MSGKSINFDNKNIKNSDFYKNKKLLKIEDIDMILIKYLSLKKNRMARKILLNISLNTLMTMNLNEYV